MSKKQTIIGYPWSDIFAIIICLFFTGIAFWKYNFNEPIFWITIGFFGIGGIALLYQTFFSGKDYVYKDSSEAILIKKAHEDEFLNGLGNFRYDNRGFTIKTSNEDQYVVWDEISKMVGFKIDLFTYDEIRLVIHLQNEDVYEFGEEIPGWFQFLERSKKQFSSIDKLWEVEIANPAFERKETIIYQKKEI